MRRNWLLVGGWGLATLLALVLGLQSIRSVSDSVTSSRPAPLSPASVKAALQRTGSVAPAASAGASNAATVPDGSGSTATDDRGSTGASTSAGSDAAGNDTLSSSAFVPAPVPGSGDSTASGSGPPPASSSGESSSSSSDDGSRRSSDSSSETPLDKTYQLVGGSVGVRFENGGAHLLWATPNSGFSVESSTDGGTVDVRFESDTHESRLRAFWDGGPQQQIEEQDKE